MQTLAGKKILLGISGGIAAYKCAELTRRLIERGAQVQVVMTKAAKEFITPLTMQAVSGRPVSDSLLDPAAEASMGHIELAKWADLVLLAPATADLIARMSAGMGNDLLTTLVLATDSPVAVSPAMNQQMYRNVATQENIATLARRGMHIWGPAAGEQACGDVGPGRMLEPMQLVHLCEQFFQPKLLAGKSVLITAGPTREAIDPVRYISNHSSGKMGFALANAAAQLGAKVTLISGPVSLNTPAGVERINVASAQEMHDAVMAHAPSHDAFISCAAVADYRPENVASQKLKKTENNDQMTINMVKNPDIVATVANMTEQRPFTVGFAAETNDVETYARGKLVKKNLDMICANDVSVEGQGFNSNDNAITLFWSEGEQALALESKEALSFRILEKMHELV
ncbi:bifunctional phosphopantothenoylcysteine decarboxylase/phosphopantothenate--cysteine ligase CoaBC [Vibrio campbellii]|jgi:phosphopantothenoylcysteine decarboxylase/phosphopantothenate--cysteine ligase|uniref:bifunctional phosphopantothenoylcysteine decarboxylase/phosphopantothenate--cysteine ligase CoaBC n=1 Tax=Vibrio campbellii TaxID=680 RepID=UPI0002ADEE0D|nr:bifunctional phosphopantothenoylcysteine decarboxylase/phosphopantothenate--cysteine ligase CoaBC [Vibrio campbellii]ARV71447.1 phosphopantothenoylcysteine decarboxylase [Vibrio campbellii CAIM 519 = NBRC 15631 = ATCC 25920]ELU50068.1 bifunctional phosphopantothenoylcysteine decarboxylase/phosphopantothenate synthase [Vibrio campbellii CAIM 519 = NBRC 15631 = ATCC 25920]HDM8043643.1 bifunctional phosphopantothenoylcysteine decarboxylase/phosphopantothenate--cysteine ligase CoaBC [Vibrio campb